MHPRPARAWPARFGAVLLVVGATASLAGCGSTIAGLPGIGQGEEAANAYRPAEKAATPSIYEPAATRDGRALNPAERAKLEADLIRARERAAADQREQISRGERR